MTIPLPVRTDETVPCTLCGKPTEMLNTELCDPCGELNTRIRKDPDIARKVLDNMEKEE